MASPQRHVVRAPGVARYLNDALFHAIFALAVEGYTLRFVEYVEDARTPGFPGQIRGRHDRERREVVIGLKANPSAHMVREAILHEVKHIRDPQWDCGSRDVLGRGAPRG